MSSLTMTPNYSTGSVRKFVSGTAKLDFRDALIVPRKTSIHSRKDVSLSRHITFKNNVCWEGTPIIASNMDTVSNLETFKVLSKYDYITCFPKFYNKIWLNQSVPEELAHTDHYMISCGVSEYDITMASKLINKLALMGHNVKFVCIDVANGYMTSVNDACIKMRYMHPNIVLVAGNVVTPEATYDLIENAGVDIVKIGIGSGSVCTTRLKAGVGYPQLAAVLDCCHAAHSAKGYIISDGGIIHPCDISKAFGAGADFVMCGSMFAGHIESPGEVFEDPHDLCLYKKLYGMSSYTANEKYNDGLQEYRAAEGKEVTILIKGSLHDTIKDINGSLRSTCTYTNSKSIGELEKNVRFIEVAHHHNTSLS